LRVNLGPRGEREAQMEPGSYTADELVGRQVVVSIDDEAIVVCARSHSHGSILVTPDREIEDGTVVA
jgi:hypothetical protein